MIIGAAAAQFFRTGIAIIRALPESIGEGALTRRMIGAINLPEGQTFQAVQAIARQALRASRAGSELDAAFGGIPTLPRLPRIPRTPGRQEQYAYRVVVVGEDVGTGSSGRTTTTIYSDTPLTAGAILDQVERDYADISNYRRGRPGVLPGGPGVGVSVIIISAGRQS